jgi:hypothetical protein
MSNPRKLKLLLAETTNEMGADPSSHSNNFAQSDQSAPGPVMNSTTTFTADADAVTSSLSHPQRINSLLTTSSSLEMDQTIKDFLAKPVALQSGVLAASDTVSSFPFLLLPYGPLFDTMYKSKVSGFLGFRATMVFRLVINANRFQQGRYMLAYVPSCGSDIFANTGNLRYLAHTNTLVQRTQLPRIELDLACDTEGTLRIPYTSVQNYYSLRATSLATGYGSWGKAQLFPYSPLVAPTGSTTCPYTIFMHFEDVELISATVPQSGRMMSRKSQSEKEQSSKGIGPIQSSLVKISQASALFKPVPMISSYASGLSWLADIGAGAAGVFGWAKPRNLDVQKKTYRETMPGIYHTDVSDVGQSLSLSSRNAVDVMPGFSSTNVDEMDFSFIATTPAWYSTTDWTTAQAVGTELLSLEVTPAVYQQQRTLLGGVVVQDYTPVAFVADYFTQWRGSMVFTLKLVKTEFHSGRLAIAFFPSETALSAAPVSLALSQYTHREIIDVREMNEITFKVPFVSASPYRACNGPSRATGLIKVYVLNSLAAPAAVSSTCKLLLEVAAGPDIEFAVPHLNTNAAVLAATPQSGQMMSKDTSDVCRIEDTTIGCSTTSDDQSLNAAACIGEKITSFRTLLKSTGLLNYTFDPAGSAKFLLIRPYFASVYYNAAASPFSEQIGDLYSTLSMIFGMSRGGVRLKVLTPATQSTSYPSMAYLESIESGVGFSSTSVWYSSATAVNGGTNTTNRLNGVPLTLCHTSANYCSEFSVPQYSRYHSRATFDLMANSNIPAPVSDTNLADRNVVTFYVPGQIALTNPLVFRGGSDDANFGVFISIPPMQKALGFAGAL